MRSGKTRALCREKHAVICAICGFTQEAALQACHIDNVRSNDDADNLVWLCQTHHVMMDRGMYPLPLVKALRDHWNEWFRTGQQPKPISRIRDGAIRAGLTRRKSAIARRAWATRRAAQTGPDSESDG
jgi:hypothetical protein